MQMFVLGQGLKVGRLVGAVAFAGALAASCASGASAEQLTWCAANQDEVGRAATDLGLIDDPLTFTDWMQNNPNDYERACMEAYQRA